MCVHECNAKNQRNRWRRRQLAATSRSSILISFPVSALSCCFLSADVDAVQQPSPSPSHWSSHRLSLNRNNRCPHSPLCILNNFSLSAAFAVVVIVAVTWLHLVFCIFNANDKLIFCLCHIYICVYIYYSIKVITLLARLLSNRHRRQLINVKLIKTIAPKCQHSYWKTINKNLNENKYEIIALRSTQAKQYQRHFTYTYVCMHKSYLACVLVLLMSPKTAVHSWSVTILSLQFLYACVCSCVCCS